MNNSATAADRTDENLSDRIIKFTKVLKTKKAYIVFVLFVLLCILIFVRRQVYFLFVHFLVLRFYPFESQSVVIAYILNFFCYSFVGFAYVYCLVHQSVVVFCFVFHLRSAVQWQYLMLYLYCMFLLYVLRSGFNVFGLVLMYVLTCSLLFMSLFIRSIQDLPCFVHFVSISVFAVFLDSFCRPSCVCLLEFCFVWVLKFWSFVL